MEQQDTAPREPSRRKFVKTVVYVAPAILTLTAIPSFAAAGSDRPAREPWTPREESRFLRFLDWLAGLWK